MSLSNGCAVADDDRTSSENTKRIGDIEMRKKTTEKSYMEDIIALAKKADVLHTMTEDEKIYISLDNAVLFHIPNNEKSDDVLQAIGIPYAREKQGQYDKKRSAFVYNAQGRKIPQAPKIFFNEREDVSYTNIIYTDKKNLMELYVQKGAIKAMNLDYITIMKKINPEYFIGNSFGNNEFMYVMDVDNKVAFGAMPIRMYPENVAEVEKGIVCLSEYCRKTDEEKGEIEV